MWFKLVIPRIIINLLFVTVPFSAFAQLNVNTFGAKGDGKTDDTAALQLAINSTPASGTLTFGSPGNVYLISARLVFLPNRIYEGNSTIRMNSSTVPHTAIAKLAYGAANSVSFSGLTFDANGVGGGIQIAVDGAGAIPADSFTLANTVIRNTTASPAGPWDSAVYAPVGLTHSSIISNHVSNCAIGFSLTNLNSVNIWNNSFTGIAVGDAISVTFNPAPFAYGSAIRINGNTGQHLGRMGIELWPTGGNVAQTSPITGAVISNNSFSGWNSSGASTFGISIMAGQNATVQSNRLIGPSAGYGIELGAANSVVSQNTVEGFVTGVILHDCSGSQISGNLLVNQLIDGVEFSNAPGARTGVVVNNNSIVNAQSFGIFVNTPAWDGASLVSNFISRAAGAFAADNNQAYTGIGITPPGTPVTVSGNQISQTAESGPAGFSFIGIRVNGGTGANTGSNYQGNTVGSQSSGIATTGLFGNSPGTMNGVTVQDNNFNGLADASAGAPSTEMMATNNVIYNCLQAGPLFPQ